MASTPTQQIRTMLAAAAAACDDKKAEDIRILKLDPSESGLTDYFLICTGLSDRQNVAITDEIELRLKRDFATYPNSVEGRRQGEWVLMDYVDFIVHVFSPEKRAFYGLERLRKTATQLSVAELNDEIRAAIAAGRRSAARPVTKAQPTAKKKPTAAKKAAKKSVAKKMASKKAPTKKSPPKKAPAKKARTPHTKQKPTKATRSR